MHFFKSLRAQLAPTPETRGNTLPDRFKKIEYLQLLIENMSQSLLIVDNKGLIQFVNNAFSQAWNYLPTDIVGQHFSMLLNPANQCDLTMFDQLVNGTPVKEHQSLLRMKDGSFKNALISASYEAIGGSSYIIALISDIDEFIETRDKLTKSEIEKMRHANTMKDDFLAQVSHELRTPASIILGWVELLIKNKVGLDKVLDAYQYIEKNAKLQIKLIDDLLDLARIERGTLHSRIELVNITECFKNALDSFQAEIHAKKIKVSAHIPKRSIEVIGDQDRLTQIFWNILSNAIKFTPEEGTIYIDIEIFQDKVEIRVEDTGIGIEREFLPHIFEKFTRESDLIKRQTGGLGLGLSIVKTLTETHGGSISIDSEGLGKGSCVTLRFPYFSHSDSEMTRIPVYGSDDPAVGFDFLKDLRILLVDDVADVTEILQMMLVSKGANVLACSNVNDAYQAVLSFKPDVLISDVAMPEHSGVDLIQKIRTLKSEEGGEIPALALTAFLRSTSEKLLLEAGFDKVLSKPVKAAELYASIKEVHARPVLTS